MHNGAKANKTNWNTCVVVVSQVLLKPELNPIHLVAIARSQRAGSFFFFFVFFSNVFFLLLFFSFSVDFVLLFNRFNENPLDVCMCVYIVCIYSFLCILTNTKNERWRTLCFLPCTLRCYCVYFFFESFTFENGVVTISKNSFGRSEQIEKYDSCVYT